MGPFKVQCETKIELLIAIFSSWASSALYALKAIQCSFGRGANLWILIARRYISRVLVFFATLLLFLLLYILSKGRFSCRFFSLAHLAQLLMLRGILNTRHKKYRTKSSTLIKFLRLSEFLLTNKQIILSVFLYTSSYGLSWYSNGKRSS